MRKTNLHGSLADMEVISNGLVSIGVHVDSDPEFRAFVLAAGTAHGMGNESIDSVLRKHRKEWTRKFEKEALEAKSGARALGSAIAEISSNRCSELSTMRLPDTSPYGATAAANALIRLDATFRSALLLCRIGHAIESEAVI